MQPPLAIVLLLWRGRQIGEPRRESVMADKRGAGRMRAKLHFQRREISDDGYGNPISGEFATVFSAAAEMMPLRGGEPVLAARLTGVQPYIVRIRSHAAARQVTPAWRIVDARNQERVFNVTAISDPDGKGAWLDVMATQGEAA
ncbi:head-tail adaptor protein [Ferirhizobium litorale]|uniref:Head-tail adaptor protein n=1 Tax=Ferirhizobium litorale TaxID=2927786 RepID=A0AAE3QG79_9HYPH|nr:head-tail adaptor protein [Fererhizobium litorale]MDI7923400.1 head-tail adaptor protein [Fererhizobium litorale]